MDQCYYCGKNLKLEDERDYSFAHLDIIGVDVCLKCHDKLYYLLQDKKLLEVNK